jgi:hypothetical protein
MSAYPTVDLWATLEQIRQRPAMWMGKKDVWSLAAFIAGLEHFSHASHGAGPRCLTLTAEPSYDGFIEWTSGLNQQSGPVFAALHIARARGALVPEIAAFDVWFELVDEYRKKRVIGDPLPV